jgi:hypothetical protein
MKIWINFDFDLLPVTNDVIFSENIHFFSSLNDKDRTSNGSWVILSSGNEIRFFLGNSFCADIDNHISLCFFVCNQYWVSRSENTVLWVWPRNFLWNLIIHLDSFMEVQCTILIFLIIINFPIRFKTVKELTWFPQAPYLLASFRFLFCGSTLVLRALAR